MFRMTYLRMKEALFDPIEIRKLIYGLRILRFWNRPKLYTIYFNEMLLERLTQIMVRFYLVGKLFLDNMVGRSLKVNHQRFGSTKIRFDGVLCSGYMSVDEGCDFFV